MAKKKRSTVNGVTKAGKRAVKALQNAAGAAAAATAQAKTQNAPNALTAKNGFLDPNASDANSANAFFKKLKTTADVRVSDKLVEQIIGQERGRKIIRKASTQKRNVLLVGYPGTGKSMLAQAMAELLPLEELQDVLIKPNPMEENAPMVEIVKAGEGRKKLDEERMKKQLGASNFSLVYIFVIFISAFLLLSFGRKELGDVITAAMLIGLFAVGGLMMLGSQLGRGRLFQEGDGMKLLIDNSEKTKAPFIEATGSRAGSLLGDVRHDPFQSIADGKIFVKRGKRFSKTSFEALWKRCAAKYPLLVERRADGYEALALPKKEKIFVLGYARGKPIATRVYSLNRRRYSGEVVEVKVASGEKIVTTPEHAFIAKPKEKPAARLKKGDWLTLLAYAAR